MRFPCRPIEETSFHPECLVPAFPWLGEVPFSFDQLNNRANIEKGILLVREVLRPQVSFKFINWYYYYHYDFVHVEHKLAMLVILEQKRDRWILLPVINSTTLRGYSWSFSFSPLRVYRRVMFYYVKVDGRIENAGSDTRLIYRSGRAGENIVS